jgi:hypothetical protein
VLDIIHGPVIQNFVRLRVVVYARRLINFFLFVENLGDLRAARRRSQQK